MTVRQQCIIDYEKQINEALKIISEKDEQLVVYRDALACWREVLSTLGAELTSPDDFQVSYEHIVLCPIRVTLEGLQENYTQAEMEIRDLRARIRAWGIALVRLRGV